MDSKADELPLSDRFWAWFEANKKQALIGLGVIVAAAAIAGFVAWHRAEKETASGEALSNVAAEQATLPPGSQNATAAYLKIADEYPKTMAGARALLLAAGNLFAEGKYDQARAQFEKFAREHGDNPLMGQALLGIASSLEAQGKTTEAIGAYKSLVERHPNDSVVPQAKFALGRLYEAQEKGDLAKSQYEDILRVDPYGSLANEAGIRIEELKWKYPNLATPPPAPTGPGPRLSIPPANAPQLKPQPPAAPSTPSTNPPLLKLQTTNEPQLKLTIPTNK